MPTLADLQTRIITETNRDDLQDVLLGQLNQSIADAIGEYADQRFAFNELRVSGVILAGQQYVPLPSGQRFIDKLYCVVGSVQFEIAKRSMAEIEALYQIPLTGQPIEYAVYAGQARLWPTPLVNYPATWLTVSDVAPTIDWSDPDTTISNSWTNEGQWLICARAKSFLYRNVFRDDAAANAAAADVAEAYARLKGYAARALSVGRMTPAW